jgi:hypothetical protein
MNERFIIIEFRRARRQTNVSFVRGICKKRLALPFAMLGVAIDGNEPEKKRHGGHRLPARYSKTSVEMDVVLVH